MGISGDKVGEEEEMGDFAPSTGSVQLLGDRIAALGKEGFLPLCSF